MTTIASLMNLRGRRALITGAAGHIGRVMAETLAELGADLVLVDRPSADYGTLADGVRERWPVTIDVVACDLESDAERAGLVDHVRERHRVLDILVNNAAFVGTSNLEGWVTPFAQQSVETWRRAPALRSRPRRASRRRR